MSVCLLFINMSLKCEVMGSILGLSCLQALSCYMCRNVMYCEICCCLHEKNIVYKHLNIWVYIEPPRYISTKVFEILEET